MSTLPRKVEYLRKFKEQHTGVSVPEMLMSVSNCTDQKFRKKLLSDYQQRLNSNFSSRMRKAPNTLSCKNLEKLLSPSSVIAFDSIYESSL